MNAQAVVQGNTFVITEDNLEDFYDHYYRVESTRADAESAQRAQPDVNPSQTAEAASLRFMLASFYLYVMQTFNLPPDQFLYLHSMNVDVVTNPMRPSITFLHIDPTVPIAPAEPQPTVTQDTLENTVASTQDLLSQDPLTGQAPNLDPNNPLLPGS